jgi:pilus biogenesis lipoprotein CpaD
MQTVRSAVAEEFAKLRAAGGLATRAAIVGGCAMFLCACNTDQQIAAGPDIPYDYRQRHPITITEGRQTLEVFVGSSRGELNATQRAEVAQFGHRWRREATGGIAIELPVGASNERAAADSVHMIRSILAATSVPPTALSYAVTRRPHPTSRQFASAIRALPRRPVLAAFGPKTSARVFGATILKTSRYGITVARRSATSPPWSTIPPTWCSRAARRRAIRCAARPSSKNTARAPRRPRNPDTNAAKISDVGR